MIFCYGGQGDEWDTGSTPQLSPEVQPCTPASGQPRQHDDETFSNAALMQADQPPVGSLAP